MGTVFVQGTGGVTALGSDYGISDGGTITSSGGDVQIIGSAGGQPLSGNDFGVAISGQVSAGGAGNLTILGTSGARFGDAAVFLSGNTPRSRARSVTSGGGNITITGVATGPTVFALDLLGNVTTPKSGGAITLVGDSMSLASVNAGS
jgi:hypothetical protein